MGHIVFREETWGGDGLHYCSWCGWEESRGHRPDCHGEAARRDEAAAAASRIEQVRGIVRLAGYEISANQAAALLSGEDVQHMGSIERIGVEGRLVE